MSTRVANFGAGPGVLPEEVLSEASSALLNFKNSGMGICEISHRSKEYDSVHTNAIETLRALLSIPDTHAVCFAQGGASMQFSAVPLNLGGKYSKALYLVSGQWSQKASKEAEKYLQQVEVIKSPKPENKEDPPYAHLPVSEDWSFDREGYDYVYYCDNETVDGVEFPFVPKVSPSIPLVVDMSSNFCSKPVDISKFGLIYAGAQKNIAPSGLVIVIVRKDLLGLASKICPTLLDYKVLVDNNSLYNTPPTFPIYISNLVFEWLKSRGGLAEMASVNQRKADELYDFFDRSRLFVAPVPKKSRSKMNVVFKLKQQSSELEKEIIASAKKAGIVAFEGHRSVGGFRASIYNAQSYENVVKLRVFLEEFESQH